jgi:valyl-tRNA synthetase
MKNNSVEKTTFGSVIPAPNPTGELHMGHFLNLSVQDLFCRWNQNLGKDIKWALALDHGGSSTEYVAIKGDEQCSSGTFSDDYILDRINSWVAEITPTIMQQIDNMNLIIDDKEFRSMGDATRYSEFLRFIKQLSKKGLIYQTDRVIPWCVHRKTFVDAADIERKETQVVLYKLIYTTEEGEEIIVESERLVLLLNEEYVLVSSNTYNNLTNAPRYLINPLGKKIEIIVNDDWLKLFRDKAVVSITPGHCDKSFSIASSQGRTITRVFNEKGVVEFKRYNGIHRDNVHDKLLKDIIKNNTLAGNKVLRRKLDFYRISGKPVEQLLVRQCFLDVSSVASNALEKVKSGKIVVEPELYRSVLENYLLELTKPTYRNLGDNYSNRDICISQQTVWGTKFSNHSCEIKFRGDNHLNYAIDENVDYVATLRLSCALWAFSAQMVYESDNVKLQELGKNSICVTGMDLTTFWIAPILLLADEIGFLPFQSVYIQPLICDVKGRKMSKSIGNTQTPADLINRFGVDAVRLSLLTSIDNKLQRVILDLDNINKIYKQLNNLLESVPISPDLEQDDQVDELLHAKSVELGSAMRELNIFAASNAILQILDEIQRFDKGLTANQLKNLAKILSPFTPSTAELLLTKH